MPLRRFSLSILLFLALIECGLAVWRNIPLVPSTAPVFTFPPAAANFNKSGKLAAEIAAYGADRGSQIDLSSDDGARVYVLYFEWDQFEVKPLMDAAFHAPEYCNIHLGYTLIENSADRSFQSDNGECLVFDSTRFADPAGNEVFMFRTLWFQGQGSMPFRKQGFDRLDRARKSVIRHIGAARVLQVGVFDAQSADHAWQSFREQVLNHLEWR